MQKIRVTPKFPFRTEAFEKNQVVGGHFVDGVRTAQGEKLHSSWIDNVQLGGLMYGGRTIFVLLFVYFVFVYLCSCIFVDLYDNVRGGAMFRGGLIGGIDGRWENYLPTHPRSQRPTDGPLTE